MFLSQPNFSKSLVTLSSIVSLVTIGNFIFIVPAGAFNVTFSNGGFEDTTDNFPDNWVTIGDVTTNTVIDSVTPITGLNQAIITNSYITSGDRNDDNSLVFNQSGTNPVDADTISDNHSGDDLQTFLGLGTYDLSIDREPIQPGFPRTSKEGSGMYQDIVIDISADDVINGANGFNISFNWAYLTNDGEETTYGLGNQDYSFVSIYDTASAPGAITVLGDSSQTRQTPTVDNDYIYTDTTYYDTNNVYTQSITGLAEGTYTFKVGFGVVDVDGYERSSALLLDEFNVQQVPFDFSPTLGLLIIGGIVGCNRLRTAQQNNK